MALCRIFDRLTVLVKYTVPSITMTFAPLFCHYLVQSHKQMKFRILRYAPLTHSVCLDWVLLHFKRELQTAAMPAVCDTITVYVGGTGHEAKC